MPFRTGSIVSLPPDSQYATAGTLILDTLEQGILTNRYRDAVHTDTPPRFPCHDVYCAQITHVSCCGSFEFRASRGRGRARRWIDERPKLDDVA
jgi:hypothetical protein